MTTFIPKRSLLGLFSTADGAADERPDDPERQFGIGQVGKRGDLVGGELRPLFGHVEAAVAGKPAQQHVIESQVRSLPAGGNIFQRSLLQTGVSLTARQGMGNTSALIRDFALITDNVLSNGI